MKSLAVCVTVSICKLSHLVKRAVECILVADRPNKPRSREGGARRRDIQLMKWGCTLSLCLVLNRAFGWRMADGWTRGRSWLTYCTLLFTKCHQASRSHLTFGKIYLFVFYDPILALGDPWMIASNIMPQPRSRTLDKSCNGVPISDCVIRA
jgi:hypothetical protein